MSPFYFETHFCTPDPGVDWPRQFAILSAQATTGEKWSPERNRLADRKREDFLRELAIWHRRVIGYSPTTSHAEPCCSAVLPFDAACEIGVRFHQDVLYHVADDLLSVSYCDGRRELVRVGRFSERLTTELFG